MKLTPAEENQIRAQRAAKRAKLEKFAKPVVDASGEPTGNYEISEYELESLVDSKAAFAAHDCGGGEANRRY